MMQLMSTPYRSLSSQPISERFGRLADADSFDIQFWQGQPDSSIFEAAHQMVLDYLLVTTGCADEPRLDRTLESFQRF